MARRHEDGPNGNNVLMNRRSMLKLTGGAIAGATALTGAVGAATTIDLGNEGLSEGDLIDPYLEDYWNNDTEVHIPEGTYAWDGSGLDATANAALIGDGAGAVFNIDGSAIRPTVRAESGTVSLRNITQTGKVTSGCDSRWAAYAESGATLLFERVNRPDGQQDGNETAGFYVPDQHGGEAIFRDCTVNHCNSGIYADSPGQDGGNNGRVVVEGGLFKNNNLGAIRLGSDDSVARNVTIVNDAPIAEMCDGSHNGRGIWVRENGNNITIKECDISYLSEADGASVPILVNPHDSGGSGTIDNCRIYHERGGDAVYIDSKTGTWDGTVQLMGPGNLNVDGNGNWAGSVSCLDDTSPYDDECSFPTQEKQFVGDGGGGGGGDTSVAVSTSGTSNVGSTSATLEGSLDDLGGASSVDVAFDYREAGTSTWSTTSTQTLSSTGGFSESVSGLSSGTDYEFRARASASDGDTDTGSTLTFTAGSSSDTSVAVSTGSASNVGSTSATLGGSLDDLGGASSADVRFDYRVSGTTDSNRTSFQTLSSTGSYSATVDGLQSDTQYDFRAYAKASDGDTDAGTTHQFTTGTASSGPAIDSYRVAESGSPNPHADITAEWSVSDADGDLDWVLVQVIDSDGMVVDASKTDASGSSASDVDYFKIKHVDGQSFDVRLLVTDAAGNSTESTRTVSE